MVKCQCMVNGVELSSMLIATKKEKKPMKAQNKQQKIKTKPNKRRL